MKTVIIKCDDQGQYTVGLQPEGAEAGEDSKGMDMGMGSPMGMGEGGDGGGMPEGETEDGAEMMPVKNIEAALDTARDLLTSDEAQDAENGQAFESGFSNVGQLSSEGME